MCLKNFARMTKQFLETFFRTLNEFHTDIKLLTYESRKKTLHFLTLKLVLKTVRSLLICK